MKLSLSTTNKSIFIDFGGGYVDTFVCLPVDILDRSVCDHLKSSQSVFILKLKYYPVFIEKDHMLFQRVSVFSFQMQCL